MLVIIQPSYNGGHISYFCNMKWLFNIFIRVIKILNVFLKVVDILQMSSSFAAIHKRFTLDHPNDTTANYRKVFL